MSTITDTLPEGTLYAVEPLYTDTRVWEIISRTAATITVRAMQPDDTVEPLSPWPHVRLLNVSDPHGMTFTVRRRKDGSYRVNDGRALRPVETPVSFTNYEF